MAVDLSGVVRRAVESIDGAVARLDTAGGGRQAAAAAAAARAATLEAPPGRQEVAAAAQAVRGSAARLAFMWEQQPPPSGQIAVGMVEAVRGGVEALLSLLQRVALGGGPTLRKAVRGSAQDLAKAVNQLLVGVVVKGARGEALLAASGLVFSRCDAVGPTVPLDDRTALGRALSRLGSTARDALREVDEALQELQVGQQEQQAGEQGQHQRGGEGEEQEAAVPCADAAAECLAGVLSISAMGRGQGGGRAQEEEEEEKEASGATGKDSAAVAATTAINSSSSSSSDQGRAGAGTPAAEDEEDEEEDGVAGRLSSWEAGAALRCREMVAAALQLMCALLGVLLRRGELRWEEVQGWESVLFNCGMLIEACDEIGAAVLMAPPIDPQEVSGAADALLNTASLLQEELPPPTPPPPPPSSSPTPLPEAGSAAGPAAAGQGNGGGGEGQGAGSGGGGAGLPQQQPQRGGVQVAAALAAMQAARDGLAREVAAADG